MLVSRAAHAAALRSLKGLVVAWEEAVWHTAASRPPTACCWHPPSAQAQHSCVASTACGVQVYISYLEIYNEVGYDLLDPTREVQAMEDLPQASSGAQHNRP